MPAKKGGITLGTTEHKHLKGDEVVAICDRNCNVIAPFVTAHGNKNESLMIRDAFKLLKQTCNVFGASQLE